MKSKKSNTSKPKLNSNSEIEQHTIKFNELKTVQSKNVKTGDLHTQNKDSDSV